MTFSRRTIGLLGALVSIGMLAAVSGCKHDDAQAAAPPSGDSHPKGMSKEDSIKAVEANPHIPEQAKANIIRQLRGGPPAQPGASKPK